MTRTLQLVRHATTEGDVPEGDFDRDLTEVGEQEAATVGRRLADGGAVPSLILHSTAKRAARTTTLLVEAAGDALTGTRVCGLDALYLASPRSILAVLAQEAGEHSGVLVVAHNPGLSELAHLLARSVEDDAIAPLGQGMRPATTVRIRFDTPAWSDLLGSGHIASCRHAS